MAVTKVGTSAPAGSTGAVTLPWPAGHQAGDLAVIYISGGSSSTYAAPALPSGCVNIGTVSNAADGSTASGNGVGFRVCYLLATSASMPALTIADVGNYTLAAMTVFRGVDQTTPIFASSVTEGPLSSLDATKSAATAPVTGLPGPTPAILIFGMGDALATNATTFGTEEVDTNIDAGTYEGTLFSAVGTLSDPDATIYTITRATSTARSNFANAWVIPKPLPVSEISGNTTLGLTSTAALVGAGVLSASVAMGLSPAGVLTAEGALQGSTSIGMTTGPAYILGYQEAQGSTTIAFNSAATLGATGALVGSTSLGLTTNGNGSVSDGLGGETFISLSPSGVLTGTGELQGSTSAVFGWTAVMDGTANAAGGVVFNFSGQGVLTGKGELAGSTSIGLTPAGTLTGAAPLSATPITMAFGQSGNLRGTANLIGVAPMTWSQSGAITGAGSLAGNTNFTMSVVGGVGGESYIAGDTSLQLFLSPATLTGAGRLVGTTGASFALLGTGVGAVQAAGSASFTLVPQGNLQAVFNPAFAAAFNARWSAVFQAQQALLNAVAARMRGTVDGHIDTFFASGAPYTAEVGDLWREDGGAIARWDGTGWVTQAELTDNPARAQLTTSMAETINVDATVDGRIRSYWAPEAPAIGGAGASEGDVWFDTDDGTVQLLWDGVRWVSSSTGAAIFPQPDEPVGSFRVGDIWIDTDDGNKLYYWDGDAWVEGSDERIAASASAVADLLSRVSATEDTITAQAASITALESAISDTQTGVDANASALDTLTTQVTSISGSKAAVFAQPTSPPTSGRVNGDIWVDTDDGNRLYIWDGSWTARPDQNGLKVFAQTTEPTSVGRVVGDLWFDTDDGNRQYRWDGSAWVNITDARVVSQAAAITALQSQVALLPAVYVQDSAPTGATYAVGDIWFDSDDGNKQYIWNGTVWDDTSTISGTVTYAQTAEPTGGAYNIGDLWIDTDNGNRIHRWNGAAWIDVSDQRMVGQADAISALETQVEGIEGELTSQASAITSLSSSVAEKTRTFVQGPTAPTATAIGDLWIDSSDANKLYDWDGDSWNLKRLDAGVRTFAQNDAPFGANPGDLWVDTNDNNRLYRWNGTSWIDYSDGRIAAQGTAISALETRTTTVEGAVSTQSSQITTLTAGLATKPRIYAQTTQPVGAVNGDLWIDTDDSNKLYTWNGSNWIYRAIPIGAKVYRQPSAPAAGNTGDLWFDSDDGNKPYIWTGSSWADNTDARTSANASALSTLTTTVSTKTQAFIQGATPSTTGRTYGDIWIDTNNGNLLKGWNGSAWVPLSDGNKNRTYAQDTAPATGLVIGDFWVNTSDSNKLYRWNGSGWVLLSDTRIESVAASVTSLAAEVAGKASVSAVDALTTRVVTIEGDYGVNLLMNPALAVDGRNWGVTEINSAARPEWTQGRDELGSGYRVSGTHNWGVSYNGTSPASDEYYGSVGDLFPIEASTSYVFSALLSMAGLIGLDVSLEAYNSSGTYLTDVASLYNSDTVYTGGTNRANWRAMSTVFTTPSTAKFLALRVRARTLAGAVNPRGHVMEPMLERRLGAQTVPTAFNAGSTAAWAEWNLTFNVDGRISGLTYGSDGRTVNFSVEADNFEVRSAKTSGFLSWANNVLWNKGTDFSVLLGQDLTPDADVVMWIGPNPASPTAALKNDAAFFITEAGDAVFRGTINQSLLTGSAMELGSTRIHTGGGRLAPFTVRAAAYKATGTIYQGIVSLSDFQSPNVGTGYHFKRFSRLRTDVNLNCFFQGHGNAGDMEALYLEVQYDGGAWTTITSKTNIDTDNHGSWVFLIRYTTIDAWNTVAFRARTVGGHTMVLSLAAEIDNTYETGNAPGSWSGTDASTGTNGSPPPPGGGGGEGGGGSFCLVADQTFLPDSGMLQDARLGTQILCWDGELESPGWELHALRKKPFGYEESFMVTAANGAEVAQSKSTPTPVRDGRLLRTEELLGQEVLTNINGVLAWSQVTSVMAMGVRRVVKPDVGDRILFAGTSPLATIATHNLRDKDIEP